MKTNDHNTIDYIRLLLHNGIVVGHRHVMDGWLEVLYLATLKIHPW